MCIYSRNCEDKTNSFPDVVDVLRNVSGGRQMVLDAEIVAIDRCVAGVLQSVAGCCRVL